MDFGTAREIAGPELTASGIIVGTPYYMSPEQATGESIDPRTDIYALGAIMFEMVTGRPPFETVTISGRIVSIATSKTFLPSRTK